MFASNLIKIEGKFKKETNKADSVSHYDNPSSASANPELEMKKKKKLVCQSWSKW